MHSSAINIISQRFNASLLLHERRCFLCPYSLEISISKLPSPYISLLQFSGSLEVLRIPKLLLPSSSAACIVTLNYIIDCCIESSAQHLYSKSPLYEGLKPLDYLYVVFTMPIPPKSKYYFVRQQIKNYLLGSYPLFD